MRNALIGGVFWESMDHMHAKHEVNLSRKLRLSLIDLLVEYSSKGDLGEVKIPQGDTNYL